MEQKSEQLKSQIAECSIEYQKLTELTTLLEECENSLIIKMEEWEKLSAELEAKKD